MNCTEARKYFPYLENGSIYFNHAAIGPLSSLVKEKVDEYINQRSQTIIENFFETLPQTKSAKEKVGRLINADVKNISWTDNVSNSLNVLAQGLGLKNGDQIILNDQEFPSNIYPFMNLSKQGIEVLFAKNENGIVDLEQIEKLVTPKTRLVSISLVQFLSGYRAKIKSIGEFCKNRNIIFSVDGIQGAGVVQVDVNNMNIDFFAGGTQKWLMGLQGLSYFYVSPNLLDKLDQKYVGWTSVKDAWNMLDYNLDLLDSAERFQNGTNSRIAMIAADASLTLFEMIGYENIEKTILENTQYSINKLKDRNLSPVLDDVPKDNLAGIISFKHEKADKIVTQLKKRKITCSLRQGLVRLSPHYYNTKDEIDFVIDEISEIINL